LVDNFFGCIVMISFTPLELEEDAAWIGKTLSADPAMFISAPAHLVQITFYEIFSCNPT